MVVKEDFDWRNGWCSTHEALAFLFSLFVCLLYFCVPVLIGFVFGSLFCKSSSEKVPKTDPKNDTNKSLFGIEFSSFFGLLGSSWRTLGAPT